MRIKNIILNCIQFKNFDVNQKVSPLTDIKNTHRSINTTDL